MKKLCTKGCGPNQKPKEAYLKIITFGTGV